MHPDLRARGHGHVVGQRAGDGVAHLLRRRGQVRDAAAPEGAGHLVVACLVVRPVTQRVRVQRGVEHVAATQQHVALVVAGLVLDALDAPHHQLPPGHAAPVVQRVDDARGRQPHVERLLLEPLTLGLGPQPALEVAVAVVAQCAVDLVVLEARQALQVVQLLAAETHALEEVALLRRLAGRRRVAVERADPVVRGHRVVLDDRLEVRAPLQGLAARVDRALDDRGGVGDEVLDEGVHGLLVAALRQPIGDLLLHALRALLGHLGHDGLGLVAQLLADLGDHGAEVFLRHDLAGLLAHLDHGHLGLLDGLVDHGHLDRLGQVRDRRRVHAPRLLAGGQHDLADPRRGRAALHLGQRRPDDVHAAVGGLHRADLRGAVDPAAGAQVGQQLDVDADLGQLVAGPGQPDVASEHRLGVRVAGDVLPGVGHGGVALHHLLQPQLPDHRVDSGGRRRLGRGQRARLDWGDHGLLL